MLWYVMAIWYGRDMAWYKQGDPWHDDPCLTKWCAMMCHVTSGFYIANAMLPQAMLADSPWSIQLQHWAAIPGSLAADWSTPEHPEWGLVQSKIIPQKQVWAGSLPQTPTCSQGKVATSLTLWVHLPLNSAHPVLPLDSTWCEGSGYCDDHST